MIYVLNIFAQLILMDSFFGFKYHSYGLDFLKKFLIGDDYSRIDRAFPRVTFCDFRIRNLADNIHQHSVQCALPINLFNEKFFICLWFWLIFLAIVTIFNFFSWLKIVFTSYRKNTITKYLKSLKKLGSSDKDKEILDTFVTDYCHLDGAFIFNLLRRNSNYITTSEIISALYERYCRDYIRPPRRSIVM
ncbi:innexin unc-9-like, partial [Brachionus plicatilis]